MHFINKYLHCERHFLLRWFKLLSSFHTSRRMATVWVRHWLISLDCLQISMNKRVVKFPSSHQTSNNSAGRGFQGSSQCPVSRSQPFIVVQTSTAAFNSPLGKGVGIKTSAHIRALLKPEKANGQSPRQIQSPYRASLDRWWECCTSASPNAASKR